MTPRARILRETTISVAINVALSLAFFLVLFGTTGPFALGAVAGDFFPQSFMIALMGTLVPSLIVNRRVGSPTRTIVLRCLAIAVTAAVFAGGLGFWWFTRQPDAELPFAQLLAIKATFGGLLALIATPIALRLLLSSTRQAKP